MKDLIVLFIYNKMIPFTAGGADNESMVAIDSVDGQAYDLWLYDDEKFDPCLSVEGELTYDEVRKLAMRAADRGLIKDPEKYDTLNESTWQEFIARSKPYSHYIVDDNGDWREEFQLSCE